MWCDHRVAAGWRRAAHAYGCRPRGSASEGPHEHLPSKMNFLLLWAHKESARPTVTPGWVWAALGGWPEEAAAWCRDHKTNPLDNRDLPEETVMTQRPSHQAPNEGRNPGVLTYSTCQVSWDDSEKEGGQLHEGACPAWV